MKHKALFGLISLFFLVLTVNNVYAVDVDISEFDDRIGEALGIGAFGGGLLITFIVLFAVLGMLGIVMKRAPSTMMVLLLGIAVFSFAISVTWFPVWSLVFIILLVAALWGQKFARGIG